MPRYSELLLRSGRILISSHPEKQPVSTDCSLYLCRQIRMLVQCMLAYMCMSPLRSSGRRQRAGPCLHMMPPDMTGHDAGLLLSAKRTFLC